MYQYMKDHEAFIDNELKKDAADLDWLAEYHLRAIQFVQHERLIHLLVTFFFGFLLLVSVAASLFIPQMAYFLLDIILVILLGFYIRHYYRLENGVQHWYDLYKEIDFRRRAAGRNK